MYEIAIPKKLTSDIIKVLCRYISEEDVAAIFRVTATLRGLLKGLGEGSVSLDHIVRLPGVYN